MPRSSHHRKRKLNSNTVAVPSQAKATTTSTNKKALKKILKTCHAPALAETLLAALDEAPPANVQALKDLMAPLIYAVANPKHCLRHHKSYDDSRNHGRACVILCNVPNDFPESKNNNGYIEFPCCSREVSEKKFERGGYNDVCFKENHTDDPEEVEYYYKYESGEGDSMYDDPNNSNVILCREKGCNAEDSTE